MDRRSVDPRTLAGDPFAHAGKQRRSSAITRRTYGEELAAVLEEEARLGRPMIPRERDAFVRGFHGQEYAEEIRRLMALGVEEPEGEE